MIARRYIFVGRVQGVGFRYTSRRIALGLGLRGYVRNCPDGSVEMFAQGPATDLERCQCEIEEAFAGYIREVKVTDHPVDGRYGDFGIRY